MLVGDVRSATIGSGSSWKLSGASQCVSSVTNFSKYIQCSFAYLRAAWRSASVRCISPRIAGRLSASAMLGLASQTRTSGSVLMTNRKRSLALEAPPIVTWNPMSTPSTRHSAVTGHILRQVSNSEPAPSARSTCEAVCHSRRLR